MMSRKKEISKHPAIMANKVAAAESAAAIDIVTDDWDELTGDQKAFIALHGIHSDVTRTASSAGKSMEWVKNQSKSNPVFAKLLRTGIGNTSDVGTKMMQMAIPYSVIQLLNIIENEPSSQVKLSAIKHLHQVTNMMPQQQQGFGGNFLNVNVKMFGDKENKVIDVE